MLVTTAKNRRTAAPNEQSSPRDTRGDTLDIAPPRALLLTTLYKPQRPCYVRLAKPHPQPTPRKPEPSDLRPRVRCVLGTEDPPPYVT